MDHLKGKAVVITGASRGIGEAAARLFAQAGAKVVLAARSVAACQAITDEIAEAGGEARAVACDVADPQSVADAIAACENLFGGLDILINNAGVIEPIGRIEDLSPEDFGRVIDVNLKGVFNGLHAALPRMAAKGGVVVNISSGAATSPLEGWSHYCASKAGALMLTRAAERENQNGPVRVVGLSPGTVATEMQVVIKASGINPVSELDPSVHIPTEWVARALAWLCGPDAEEFRGVDVSLRDEDIRRRIGLIN